MTKQHFHVLGLLFVAWGLFNLSAALWVEPSAFVRLISAGLFCLTLFRPSLGIGVFLVMMPVYGGSKPGDAHTIHFLQLLTALNLGLCLRFLQHLLLTRQSLTLQLGHPMVFTAAIYWLVALLSLSTVTPDGQLSFLLRFDPLGAYSFLALNEAQKIYSWYSWLLLGQSLLFGFFLYSLDIGNRSLAMRWTFCVLAGLVVSLVAGILDFYDLINLSGIRPAFALAEYGNEYRHLHLSSFFGNPGWYAQFVTIATPAVLSILALPTSRPSKILLLIGIMALTEFTLILAYQRGGWLSYPLTLLVVWFCIYVLDVRQQSAAEITAKAKKSIIKIMISFPITIALSLTLVYGFAQLATNIAPNIDSYIARGADISKTHDRLIFWKPTTVMFRKHPILGSGNESFGYEFNNLYRSTDAKYNDPAYSDPEKLNAGTAHNLYFQSLTGKGMAGLVSLLAVLGVSLATIWSLAFRSSSGGAGTPLSLHQRLTLMMALSFTAALAIYGNVGEMFYTPINHILFVFFYALVVREVPISKGLSKRQQLSVLAVVSLAFLGHLVWEYGYPGLSRDTLNSGNPTGCFDVEGDRARPGAQYRWCSRHFSISVPVTVVDGQAQGMLSLAPRIPGRDSAFTVKVFHKGRLLDERSIPRGMETDLLVPLPAEALSVSHGGGVPDRVILELQTNDSFIPSLQPGTPASSDSRNLSVQWFFNRTPEKVNR